MSRAPGDWCRVCRSSSAPLSTKKTDIDRIHRSRRSISSSEVGQMLRTQCRSSCRPAAARTVQCTGRTWNFAVDRPTVGGRERGGRPCAGAGVEVDLQLLAPQPAAAPKPSESRDSEQMAVHHAHGRCGPVPVHRQCRRTPRTAPEPAASSMATTISSRRVKGASALYCLTTSVAAGAVAAATRPESAQRTRDHVRPGPGAAPPAPHPPAR